MKARHLIAGIFCGASLAAPSHRPRQAGDGSGIPGFDISGHDRPDIDWAAASNAGLRWVLIKATENIDYISPTYQSQWTGAIQAGFFHGAYHFAQPTKSSAVDQATYFVKNGGNWTNDGLTLPGMLDIEYNPDPNGDTCYGIDGPTMVQWIREWVDTYHNLTTRYPIIYSTANWWNQCTGSSAEFGATCPLDIARYREGGPDVLPAGWTDYAIWQNNASSPFGGDSDFFKGDLTALKKLATG